MEESTAAFYTTIVKCATIIFIFIIVAVTVYNIVDIAGPIRPRQSSIYYWPPTAGSGSTISGSNNSITSRR